nr:immunoglobulin heavy chain junction region [Mus musculus]MBK4184530.1 immunoglobulin heavy chain junction region [Mus musculus]MBK4197381.1 immunoglobulin heavy chain junction region [Mus musculus]MBK4197383.1 immunoglobulin heavy chain junction region [Mus musculus]MBK4197384.1 immunoglobulin heavy chain junction region [Mus musculus]
CAREENLGPWFAYW